METKRYSENGERYPGSGFPIWGYRGFNPISEQNLQAGPRNILDSAEIKNNMKLEITKEKVLEAASKCSTAKETLKTLFPEVFEPSRREKANRIISPSDTLTQERRLCWAIALTQGIPASNYDRIPGSTTEDKTDSVILALAEKFGW